ncbi:MAG: hypothetical protein ACYC8W_07290 [Candidatus Tyrphobacter sp.]
MKRLALAFAVVACVAAPASAQMAPRPFPSQTPASSFIPFSTPAPHFGPPMAVDDVLAQSIEYDGKPVRAVGTVRNLRTDTTPSGPVLQFDLCGHRCILVLDATNPTVADAATATIAGTFHRHFVRGRFSQNDVILIVPGGLPRDDSQDWRRTLEGYPPTPRP